MTTNCTPIRQLQLPAFSAGRDRRAALDSAANRSPICLPKHTEPTIRKNRRGGAEELSINTTRLTNQPATRIIYNLPAYQTVVSKSTDLGSSMLSRRCLIDYPTKSSNRIEDASSLSSSSRISSYIDEHDNSSTSGVYTDELQQTESKETMEVLSITSIADSQLSLNKGHRRPIVHHYRRPMSVFEAIDDESQFRQESFKLSNRSCSAEGILKTTLPLIPTKVRQPLDLVDPKPEKVVPINRSSSMALEKAGFIRVGNDSYRLTNDTNEQLYHRRTHSIDSFARYSDDEEEEEELDNDTPLPPANDEECYATLPRTSSTEQLNNHLQEDLRLLVDQYIRPMIGSMARSRLTRNQQQRFKRPNMTNDLTPLKVEDISDKLLSSIDCSIYSQYQRCF